MFDIILEVMTAAEQHRQLIKQLEFQLYKAEHGLAMPYSREDVAYYRQLLAEALAADPNSADVQLAAKLATCPKCEAFFARFKCSAATHGECDCPRCQGYCKCEATS